MIQGPKISNPIWAAQIAMALMLIVLAVITALYLSFLPDREFESIQAQTNGNRDRAQQNQTASFDELTDLQGDHLGESNFVVEFDVYGIEELKPEIDALHDVSVQSATVPEPNPAPSPTTTPADAAMIRILRIEPSVRAVALYGGDFVPLATIMHDHRGIIDDSLADFVNLTWEDGDAGGSFEILANGVLYTVPENSGRYTVSATVNAGQCFGDENQCRAEFEITVRSGTPVPWFYVPPIPTPIVITVAGYVALTPVEGGTISAEGFNLSVLPGAVRNGEIISVNIRKDNPASNVDQTLFGFTLADEQYSIAVVDASGEPISSYPLEDAAEFCILTPSVYQHNLSDISMVSLSDAELTVLPSRVEIHSDGRSYLCGDLTILTGRIAAAKPSAPELPTTGGRAVSLGALMVLMLIGAVGIACGVSTLASGKRRVTSR